jgi:ribosomal protein L11 methylase PrmA
LATKKRFVADFVSASKPATIWDLGCNDGEFLDLALANGAKFGVGLDNDRGALDKAVIRADTKNLNFLPLFQDAANPTPGQGWLGEERQSIHDRANPDAVLALAIVHHLALGRNIPLPEVVARIVETAPTGVIEYVAKNDPMVDRILSFKGDIFSGYRQDAFEQALSSHARIVKTESVSKDKRTLYWFDRR